MAAQPSASKESSAATPVDAAASSSAPAPAPNGDAGDDGSRSSRAKDLPVRDKESFNKILAERYLDHDQHHQVALNQMRIGMEDSLMRLNGKIDAYRTIRETHRHHFPPRVLYGEGYNGYANGHTELPPRGPQSYPSQLLYPAMKQRPGRRKSPALTWKKRDMKKQAELHEELVPVRIDLDWDKIRLRDTFTWNLHDRIVPLELFTQQMLEDLGIDPTAANKPVFESVAQQAHDQLMDFYPFAFSEEDALDPELPYSAYKNDEMRILVKLNITIGQVTLIDQFEWDMNNPLNSPEDFAAGMSRDLALSGEFTTAIAHCIREQCQLFTRGLYGVGHPFDGRPVEDPDLVESLLPSPLPAVFRPQQQAKDYAPYLYELSDADIDRNELVFSREQRRQKRSINRRGGPQLPDLKERQRTIRTLVVSSVLPGAAIDIDDSTLYKRAPGAPGSRRRPGARDGELSDSDDSEDSGPDSPAVSQLGGTARTRALRGAATTAQQRMANLGRSETPEASIIHHHETRRAAGRGGRDMRDETEEPTSMIVTLKVGKDKLRRLLSNPRARVTPSGSHTSSTPAHTRAPSTSAGPNSMPPPTTPAFNNQSLPPQGGTTPTPQSLLGGVPAPAPAEGQSQPPAPPPPEWLSKCLQLLQERYPHDRFEGTMRYSCINPETDMPIALPQGPQHFQTPPGHRWMFLPRIRCPDCPGKSYTPGPEMTTDNFERHLKMNSHRKNVDTRCGMDTKPKFLKPAAEGGTAS